MQGNARLASGGLAEEIERLRAEPGEGNIAIGGATLAAEAAALGLIDEFRIKVYPVLHGPAHGLPSVRSAEGRVSDELDERVSTHYGWSGLQETIEQEMRRKGVDPEHVTVAQLAPVDWLVRGFPTWNGRSMFAHIKPSPSAVTAN